MGFENKIYESVSLKLTSGGNSLRKTPSIQTVSATRSELQNDNTERNITYNYRKKYKLKFLSHAHISLHRQAVPVPLHRKKKD